MYRPNQFRTLEFADFMVLDKVIKLEFLIFHSRNSHRQSTRKRWQNRSRRNWAQMASSANNNAMQKGKDFFKSQKLFWPRVSWSNQVFKGLLRSLFSHRFLLIMQKKRRTTTR